MVCSDSLAVPALAVVELSVMVMDRVLHQSTPRRLPLHRREAIENANHKPMRKKCLHQHWQHSLKTVIMRSSPPGFKTSISNHRKKSLANQPSDRYRLAFLFWSIA
jgi:hypothetical protein